MKRMCAILLLSLYHISLNALAPNATSQAYWHLVDINNEWKNHVQYAPKKYVNFNNDLERIKYHLELVVEFLRQNPPENISDDQLLKRTELIGQLSVYAEEMVFPTNLYHAVRTPYFIDDYGVFCAVGHLIKMSGHENLARRISKEHNYDYVKDIKTEGLVAWANEFGFTVDELAWIQPGYAANEISYKPFGQGTNGEITYLGSIYSYNHEKLVIAGEFTQLGDQACSGIGYYDSTGFHCISGGITGRVNDVSSGPDISEITVVGRFQNAASAYQLKNNIWNEIKLPDTEHTIGNSLTNYYKSTFIALSRPDSSSSQVWQIEQNSIPKLKYTANGFIADISYTQYGFAIAGQFSEVTIIDSNTTYNTRNLLIHHFDDDNDYMPDTVLTFNLKCHRLNRIKRYENLVYFLGTNRYRYNNYSCVYKFRETSILPINYGYLKGSVMDMLLTTEESYLVGDFEFNTGMFSSKGVCTYNPMSEIFGDGGQIDGKVNSIALEPIDNQIIIGGSFAYDGHIKDPIHLVAIEKNHSATEDISNDVKIYPNPVTNGKLTLKFGSNTSVHDYQIFDLSGKMLINQHIETSAESLVIDVSKLEKGVYLLSVNSQSGAILRQQVVIE
ncbi:T9SS type A sorting domain-containing protein [bacterium]|nr:T9SS type A sorting domain-containing protein [bacterium]